eukprot:CAMPEP_0204021264 /NCGR_PEP_ID=MMETSP0360-20130528/29983_1 /ASSEMBLY_ACC=CAM_ASM_000342 /TAXON_ID=268821 /ORGANISM="Scrippsiella Hangoei, Strain SHTV-5" /LENGTH=30 /DNA_ID= /DNA_START= /DNA_END= /DNA_ORIENTATION=
MRRRNRRMVVQEEASVAASCSTATKYKNLV